MPGKLLGKRVLKINYDLWLSVLIWFYLGVFLIIGEYYILYCFNAVFAIKIIPLIFSFIEVIITIRYNCLNIDIVKTFYNVIDDIILFEIVFLILTISCMLFTNFNFPYQDSLCYSDRTYQISHIAGFATNNPFMSMTVYGSHFKYHYFYYLFLSCAKIIFSYDAYYLLNQLVVTHIPFLLTVSLMRLFKLYSKKPILLFAFIFATILSLFGYKSCYFTIHILSNHNSVGFALPLFILICIITYKFIKNDNKMNISFYILICALTFLLTGIKAPAGLLFIGATIFYILLFNRRKKNVILSILIAASFFITYYFVIYNNIQTSYFDINNIFGNVSLAFFNDAYNSLNNDILKCILRFFALPMTFLKHFNIFIIPIIYFAALTIRNTLKNSENNYEYYTIITSAGVFAGFAIAMTGNSNYYFLMMVFPFIALLTLRFFNMLSLPCKFILKIILIVFIIVFAPMNLINLYNSKNTNEIKGFVATLDDIYNYNSFNHKISNDFEAYNYIKNNTSVDSLIATNMQFQNNNTEDFRMHNLAAFGERHVYLEGYQYAGINSGYADLDKNVNNNKVIFSNISNYEKYNLIKELGIDYIFFYKNIGNNYFDRDSLRFIKEFDNNEVSIYRVLY